jgi:hypothetical protein
MSDTSNRITDRAVSDGRMAKRSFALRAGAVAALMLAGVLVAAAPAAAAEPHVTPIDPVAYDDPDALMALYRVPRPNAREAVDPIEVARCGTVAPQPVPDGQPIVVVIPPGPAFTVGAISTSMWRNPPVTDPTWRQNFQAMMWLKPLARRAAQDNQQQSLTALVNQAVAFHRQNPDPGTISYGWDEGTANRRLETENCLFALTGSQALVAGMVADAAVLLGARYYGPPNFPVHNHGLMANLQLIRAADMIDRPAWKATAIRRITSEAPQAFSRIGTSWEQASMYQRLNAGLWDQAANALESAGSPAAATSIRATVAAAYAVFAWMTEPDGDIVQVGNSDQQAGQLRTGWTDRALRDDPAGWIIGRWSWSDATTSHYTIRYGPRRRGHGHHDRAGGVTWSTHGVRVLVGPGRFNYDGANNYNIYQLSPQGQNVAIPDTGTAGTGAASVAAGVVQAPAHGWQIRDTVYGTAHTRGINVNRDARRIQVSDSFPNKSLWRQHWHLDPAWTLVSSASTQLVFSHPAGRRLTVTTTGRVSGVILGQTRPPAGWHFPRFGVREWAAEIIIRSYGTACTTTFVVT